MKRENKRERKEINYYRDESALTESRNSGKVTIGRRKRNKNVKISKEYSGEVVTPAGFPRYVNEFIEKHKNSKSAELKHARALKRFIGTGESDDILKGGYFLKLVLGEGITECNWCGLFYA